MRMCIRGARGVATCSSWWVRTGLALVAAVCCGLLPCPALAQTPEEQAVIHLAELVSIGETVEFLVHAIAFSVGWLCGAVSFGLMWWAAKAKGLL